MSRKDLLSGAGPVLGLRQALYRACRDFRGGINAVALIAGIEPDALTKVLNPNDSRPIRPEWIEEIISITQDPRLLAALVRPAGAVAFVPEPVRATHQALRALGGVLRAKGDFVESLHTGLADGEWEHHEVAALAYHADEAIGQILAIVAGARAAAEASEGADHG